MTSDMIDSRDIDPTFRDEIVATPGGEGLVKCFACGSCTARCPEMDVSTEWDPRIIIHKALLGLRKEVYEEMFVWVCSAHYRCLNKCPQEVDVKSLMNAVREVRLEEEALEDALGEKKPRSDLDADLKYKVASLEENLYACFACGACTAGCPERELEKTYSARRVIHNVKLGRRDAVFSNRFVEICSTHSRCLAECPQKVRIPELMSAIRSLAERDGYMRPDLMESGGKR